MKLDLKSVLFGLMILSVSPDAFAQKKAQSAPILPIRQGYYAANESCASALRNESGLFFRGRSFEMNDVVFQIVRITRRSTVEYAVAERTPQQDGDEWNTNTSRVRILGPTSFTRTVVAWEGVPESKPVPVTHRFCSPNPPKNWNW